MSRFDQAKMLLQIKKVEKEMEKHLIEVTEGDGAVRITINGKNKIHSINIDPEYVDLDDIGQLERWVKDAFEAAIRESQAYAADKMQPFMGMLGNLGL